MALSLGACGDMRSDRAGTAFDSNRAVADNNNRTAADTYRDTAGGNGYGVTDFGDTDRSLTEKASDALEDGVRRARDGLENARESADSDMNRAANP